MDMESNDVSNTPAEQPEASVQELLDIEQVDIVHIDIGGKDLLVRAADMTEIIRPVALTPVPMGPDHLLGLANVHGQVVCIVDPSKVMALPAIDSEVSSDTRFMLLRHAKMHIGIWVDKVHALYTVNAELVPAQGGQKGAGMDIEGKSIDMLDCEALLQ